jgi:S1-C subfamily serine protease
VEGQKVFTIGAPLREQKGMAYGTVGRVEAHAVASDFRLALGSTGGPVFAADSVVVGITSVVDEKDEGGRGDSRVVRIDEVCGAVAAAEKKMNDAAPPDGTPLPVEPVRPFRVDALRDAVQRRAGSLNPYQMSSSDFDIAFITPVLAYGAQYQPEPAGRAERSGAAPAPDAQQQMRVRPLMDFSNWSAYVADFPPVLLVRVTPKLVESFWTTVARGAAQTQGVALPAIKHVKSGFSRMRAFCGDAEVTPIHPFKLEQRVSESDTIYEGFYVFDPDALGPPCGTVKVVLYSAKEPEKGDTRVVDPKVLQQIWQDFAPNREL